jgi:uncharacterized protein
MNEDGRREAACAALLDFHREIDARARDVEATHGPRLTCHRGCHSCCVDELTVFAVEAERIRRNAPELLASAAPGPLGACAFLDGEGACRVYEHRPYVCRTQGLPLRWLDEAGPGGPAERRDICPLNFDDDGPALEDLPGEACWTIGPPEARLRRIQREFGAGRLERVALRSLFSRPAG